MSSITQLLHHGVNKKCAYYRTSIAVPVNLHVIAQRKLVVMRLVFEDCNLVL
jgi:hypothetical protein